ncbi:MAG: S1C family serine protease [Bacilli bacterium]
MDKNEEKDNFQKEDNLDNVEIDLIKKNKKQSTKKEKKNIDEQSIYQSNNSSQKRKNNSQTWILIISIIAILIIGIIAIYEYLPNNIFENKNKIELKYTETNTTIKEGVYITDVSEVVENVMPSIVAITSKTIISSGRYGPSYFSQNQYSEGAGSGIIISKSDTELMILTNNHVVENTEELTVKFINDQSVDATIKGVSERKDIAIISIKLSDIDAETLNEIKIATIGSSDELKVGNGIIAIGNALGYGQSVTTGVVSALNREVTIDNYTNNMIQIDAAINGGNSGGALLNSKGEVVGINSAKYSSNSSSEASIEGMGFAIPISDVKDLITDLINGNGDIKGATLGVEGYMIDDTYSSIYNIPTGFYISKITKGSAADKANLEIGNIITEIDGISVKKFSDLSNVLYEKNSGDEITLKIKYPQGLEYLEKEVKVIL